MHPKLLELGIAMGERVYHGVPVRDVWPSVRVEWEKAPWSQGCLRRSCVDITYGDGHPDRNGRIPIRSTDGWVLRTKPKIPVKKLRV